MQRTNFPLGINKSIYLSIYPPPVLCLKEDIPARFNSSEKSSNLTLFIAVVLNDVSGV